MGAVGTGGMLAMMGAFLAVFLVIGVIIYVYMALALSTIAKKLSHPRPWLAWIPYANYSLILMMGGFHWAWVFLAVASFIPFLGVVLGPIASIAILVLCIISFWRIAKARNMPGWTSLLLLIPIVNLVIIGIYAWKD